MSERDPIRYWFSEELSDEAAYGIYLFLAEFSTHFERAYGGEIRRHIESISPDRPTPEEAAINTGDSGASWSDDLPF